MGTFTERVRRYFGQDGKRQPILPKSAVVHDPIDELVLGDWEDEAPRLRSTMNDPPRIAPDVEEPEPIDPSTASQEEVLEWQSKVKRAREARDEVKPYSFWRELESDVFYRYHTLREEGVVEQGEIDPTLDHHRKVVSRIQSSEEFQDARAVTRFNDMESAMATIATVGKLKHLLESELREQAERADEMEEQRKRAEEMADELDELKSEAKDRTDAGKLPLPDELREKIKQAVADRNSAQDKFADMADQQLATPFTVRANELIQEAVEEGANAAKAAANIPSFGQGFGSGETKKVDPETALNIAEQWSEGVLRDIAEMVGKINPDMRYKRAKRIEGGNEEIVDVILGNDLRDVLTTEFIYLTDEDMELEFLRKFYSGELAMFAKVGEANAGRGPIQAVIDGSGSMQGDRNIWARAVILTLLNIARLEKRDFSCTEFSSGGQTQTWIFKAKEPIDPELVLDMASHFFGGGTSPTEGMAEALRVIRTVPEFTKADIVLISDGEAGFGEDDRQMRQECADMAVRVHGIGIGGSFRYLREMCEQVDSVHDFELDGPNDVTTQLATHIN